MKIDPEVVPRPDNSIRTYDLLTPLGPDILLFHQMEARESLSQLSEYHLDMLSLAEDIDPASLLGQRISIQMELPGDQDRYFTGYVTRFSHMGVHGRYYRYQAHVSPWLWFLTRTADCRIFQDKTVPEIIQEVLKDCPLADYRLDLTGTYRKRGYCVQYRETDFDFLSRLMEEEGIYYYFQHGERNNTLILADAMSTHIPYPGYEALAYLPQERLLRAEREFIHEWAYHCVVKPGKVVLDDYDHTRPSVDLRAASTIVRDHEQSDSEIFDYPGTYYAHGDGEHYAKTRIESLQASHERVKGESNARGIAAGCLFTLTTHPREDQNHEHLIVDASYVMKSAEYESSGLDEMAGPSYECKFTAQRTNRAFRPKRSIEKPTVKGPQTGVVVGPAGDEIYTDKYGRVKVQFHWDRYGEHDENSSCWMRVSHPWAGKNWGMVSIPRIGQEVIVDFLEGDPDRPIITGRVYNAEQMPPYDLPANMTQTGIKSRSTKEGHGGNFNEFRFEDKKGAEQVFIHAERNMDTEVEANDSQWVGANRSIQVDGVHNESIKKDMTVMVLEGNQSNTVKTGEQENIVKGDIVVESQSGQYVLTAATSITLKVGSSSIVMTPDDITIVSPQIHLNP